MRKVIFILLVALSLKSGAQNYQRFLTDSITLFKIVPLAAQVFFDKNNHQPAPWCLWADKDDWTAETDSIYKTVTYKRFYHNGFTNFMGLLREDSIAKKVYFIAHCDTTETLLYDFSLPQGDSINYVFANGGSMPDGMYTADSIRVRHDYKNYYHKHFYLRNHSNSYNQTLEIIEGVGNVNHPLFLYYMFNPGALTPDPHCPSAYFDEVLTCKWNNGVKVYMDSCAFSQAVAGTCAGVADTCDYTIDCIGIKIFEELKNISLYPNPAGEKIFISIESEKEIMLSISVVTILGVEVKKQSSKKLVVGKNISELDVRNLADGIYILKISDGERTLNKNFMVSH